MNGQEAPADSIAVTGLACRFPGAADAAAFWRLLCDGREGITRFDSAALRAAGVDQAVLDDPRYVKARGCLADAEAFDAAVFGIPPGQAARMDPQRRVFLECCWAALDDAGHDPARSALRIGVFAGARPSSAGTAASSPASAVQDRIERDVDFTPSTVSYHLDLRGPSVAVQTACSTSLVAVHLACQSLLSGDADLVLAGGVAIAWPQERGYRYVEGGIASPDGHCRAFDRDAAGTVTGNGVGVVVLRRLADAVADGDAVRALLIGSAINNDGGTKAGFAAPGVSGQIDVVREALSVAGVRPDSIGMVEAHGTGTALGDPIEVAALTEAFGGVEAGGCALGSVKTNIGHLDAAAGVAGLIKTVLAVQHGVVPPSLHYRRPNAEIEFARTPFFVNDALRPWPRSGVRRAGVSAFGVGGTNAHVVVQEAPDSAAEQSGTSAGDAAVRSEVLPLSGQSVEAVLAAAAAVARHLQAEGPSLAAVAHTLQSGRRALLHRVALVADSTTEAAAALQRVAAGAVRAVLPEAPVGLVLADGEPLPAGEWLSAWREAGPALGAALARGARVLQDLGGGAAAAWLAGTAPPPADAAEARAAHAALQIAAAEWWQRALGAPVALVASGTGATNAARAVVGAVSVEAALRATLGGAVARPERDGGAPPVLCGDDAEGLWAAVGRATREARVLLQVGVGSALVGQLAAHPDQPVVVAGLDPRARNAQRACDQAVAALWAAGVAVDWRVVRGERPARRVSLPGYPFARVRLPWSPPVERPVERTAAAAATGAAAPAARAPAAAVDFGVATLAAWQHVFGDAARADDDFFELGGNSLLAFSLIAELEERTGRTVTLREVFDAPSAAALAARLRDAPASSLAADADGVDGAAPPARSAAPLEAPVPAAPRVAPPAESAAGAVQFSLLFFSADGTTTEPARYRLLLECARAADRAGFAAVWTPERHFQAFGGLYPNPAVTAAALATATERIALRAGSVVLPLHHPVRVAEDWAVIDNLSGGRVGLSVACGWHPRDFVLARSSHATRGADTRRQLEQLRALWAGESVAFDDCDGGRHEVRILPRPVQAELPLWISIAANPETWRLAAELGTNVLTGLVNQPIDVLAQRIAEYRQLRRAAGHEGPGQVTVMLHCYLGAPDAAVFDAVRAPMRGYLRAFLAQHEERLDAASAERRALRANADAWLEHAVEGHLRDGALFGSVDTAVAMVQRLVAAGVDEIACLLDFGLSADVVLAGLEPLDALRRRFVGGADW